MDNKIKEMALEIGIIIDNVEYRPGTWHRVPIIGKSKLKKDGSYRIIEESDPLSSQSKIICIVKNWVTDEVRSAWVNAPDHINRKSTIYNAAIKRNVDKLAHDTKEAEQKTERWTKIYSKLDDHSSTHPYFIKKRIINNIGGVRSGPYVIWHDDKQLLTDLLIYPVFSITNETVIGYTTIYYINNIKHVRNRGLVKSGYFMIGKVTENTKCIFIGEGIATVWAMQHLNQDWVGVVIGAAFNFEEVTKYIYDKYSNVKIILLVDNDIQLAVNKGLKYTAAALGQFKPTVSVKGKLINDFRLARIIPESVTDAKSFDWWDTWDIRGSEFCVNFVYGYLGLMDLSNSYGIYRDILVKYQVDTIAMQKEDNNSPPLEVLSQENGFNLTYKKIGFPILLCSVLRGGSSTIIESTLSTLIIKLNNMEYSYGMIEVNRSVFNTIIGFKKELINNDWDYSSVVDSSETLLQKILLSCKPYVTYHPVRTGWVESLQKFGLPYRLLGGYKVIPYDGVNSSAVRGIKTSGTLVDWQEKIGSHLNKVKIAHLAYAIFGYALVARLGNTGINPIVMIKTNSGYGKSLLGNALASMVGVTEILKIQNSVGEAGLENSFSDFNDLPIFMDELTKFSEKSIEAVGYLYGNGKGAQRGTKVSGQSQNTMMWRGCAYATSEKTMAELRKLKGLPPPNAGEETRIINLTLDYLTEQDETVFYSEIYDNEYRLFDLESANALELNINKIYGTPLVYYVSYLEEKGFEYIKDKIQLVSTEFYRSHERITKTVVQKRLLKQMGEMLAGFYLTIEAKVCLLSEEEALDSMTIIFKKWLQYNQESIDDEETPIYNLAIYIQSQLDSVLCKGTHSYANDSGWDYIVQNGEYKNGVFPLKASDNKVIGSIHNEKGVNVITIFNKNINYAMGGTLLESRITKTNLNLLTKYGVLLNAPGGGATITVATQLQEHNNFKSRASAARMDLSKVLEKI